MIKRRLPSSRLSRTSEKQNRKQTIIFTIGIIIILFVLFQFGPIFINDFGNFVYGLRGDEEGTSQNVEEFISPPSLREIPEATKESFISFKGSAPESDGIVEIYLNDELVDEIRIGEDLNFDVNDLLLENGQNVIKSRFVKDKRTSSFSPEKNISYIKDKPKLEVSYPGDNATFTKADRSIVIRGKTDPDNTLTVNSFRAIVESDGEFSYQYQLNDGENTLEIEAKNPAGVTEKKTIKVTYQP